VRKGAALSVAGVPAGRRSSVVATGLPRVLVIGGKLEHVRKAGSSAWTWFTPPRWLRRPRMAPIAKGLPALWKHDRGG
jgi:hypothetical protein